MILSLQFSLQTFPFGWKMSGPNAHRLLGDLATVLGLGHGLAMPHTTWMNRVLLGLDLSLGSTHLISQVATEMSRMRYAKRPDKRTRTRLPLIARSCTTQSTNVYRLLPIATARILSGKTVNVTQRTRVWLSLVNDD